MQLLQTLSQERGVTVLLSSHLLAELHQLATDYIFLDQGRILQQITRRTLDDRCQRHILLYTADTPGLTVALERLGYLQFRVLPNDRVQVQNCYEKPAALEKKLQQAGAPPVSAAAVGMELEDYFLGLVERAREARV